MLRVLSVQADRVYGHHILRVPQEKVTDHLAASVPSLADATRGVDSGQVYCRYDCVNTLCVYLLCVVGCEI